MIGIGRKAERHEREDSREGTFEELSPNSDPTPLSLSEKEKKKSNSNSSVGTPSQTASFFGTSKTSKPPSNRKSSTSSDASVQDPDSDPVASTSKLQERSSSAFSNLSPSKSHQTTRLPTLPFSGDGTSGFSSSSSSSSSSASNFEGSSFNPGSRLKGGAWFGPGHMRNSSAGSDDWKDNFTNSPVTTMDSSNRLKDLGKGGISGLSTIQRESGWGTTSSGYSPTSSRLRERDEREGNDRNGASNPNSKSTSSSSGSSMYFLMTPEGGRNLATGGRRNGGGNGTNSGNPTRHSHGPSENASGSSLIPTFLNVESTTSSLLQSQKGFGDSFKREGLPETSDGRNSLLFDDSFSSTSSTSSHLHQGDSKTKNLKVQTTFRLPSGSHSPDERIGNPVRKKELEREEEVEDEDEEGKLIGPYQVVSTLGVGAFSKVVLGKQFRGFKFRSQSQKAEGKKPVFSSGSPFASTSTSTTIPDPTTNFSLSQLVHSNSNHLGAPEVFVRRPSVTPEEREKELIRLKNQDSSQRMELDSPSAGEIQEDVQEKENQPYGLVALKIMAREPCKQNERMNVSWVRKVEVLKVRFPILPSSLF